MTSAGLVEDQNNTPEIDSFNKVIEDVFLNGQRINPKTEGSPDLRLDIRENRPLRSNLINDSNFGQTQRQTVIRPSRTIY